MPSWARQCKTDGCSYYVDFVLEKSDDPNPSCPQCGGETYRSWGKRFPNIIRDEFVTPMVDDIMDAQTQVFHTKSEHRRAMKERGLSLKETHVGLQGSDKSPHTTRWDAGVDLKAAEDLIRRHYPDVPVLR